MPEFYCIGAPGTNRQVRGEVGPPHSRFEFFQCPVNPNHQPLTKQAWNGVLRNEQVKAQLKHNRRDYMMIWTTPWRHCLIHERLASAMQARGFSGYSLAPAEVRFRDGQISREYQRFEITGWAGLARPESGIGLISECTGCTLREYSRLKDPTQLIDERQWSGDDFFIVWPMYMQGFVTRRVAEYFQSAKVASCIVRPLERSKDLDYPLDFDNGHTVGSVTGMYPPEFAAKFRRPPDIA